MGLRDREGVNELSLRVAFVFEVCDVAFEEPEVLGRDRMGAERSADRVISVAPFLSGSV